jgi:hypothetical protein
LKARKDHFILIFILHVNMYIFEAKYSPKPVRGSSTTAYPKRNIVVRIVCTIWLSPTYAWIFQEVKHDSDHSMSHGPFPNGQKQVDMPCLARHSRCRKRSVQWFSITVINAANMHLHGRPNYQTAVWESKACIQLTGSSLMLLVLQRVQTVPKPRGRSEW